MKIIKGDAFAWNQVHCVATRVARDGSWVDLRCRGPHGEGWSKRQAQPLPAEFIQLDEAHS